MLLLLPAGEALEKILNAPVTLWLNKVIFISNVYSIFT